MCELYFFFQAEDGIRDIGVTGVQTCALPIYAVWAAPAVHGPGEPGGTGSVVEVDELPGTALVVRRQAFLDRGGFDPLRSEERRVGKSVDLGGRRIIKKKN